MSNPTFLVGTCVRITSEVEVEGAAPDSVEIISIKDPTGKTVLEGEGEANVAMTQVGETNVYEYIWQTESDFAPGEYTALIAATKGDYIAKSELKFNLEAQT